MKYNYDFYLHHQLLDAGQMFGEFESSYYDSNFHNVVELMEEGGNSCFSSPSLGNLGTYVKQSRCYKVVAILHNLIYEPFDSFVTLCSMSRGL